MEKMGAKEGTATPEEPYWVKRTQEVYGKIKSVSKTQINKRFHSNFLKTLQEVEQRHDDGLISDEVFWRDIHEVLHNYAALDSWWDIET